MILLKRPSGKKPTKTKLKKKADILFSKWIRCRDLQCVRCQNKKNLQCAHIITRANLRLRYDPQNAITLCYGCHLQFWHRSPLEAVTWFIEKYPSQYAYLLKAKNEVEKIDYEQVISFYSNAKED